MITSTGNRYDTNHFKLSVLVLVPFRCLFLFTTESRSFCYVSVISLSFYSPIILVRHNVSLIVNIVNKSNQTIWTSEHYTTQSNLLFYCVWWLFYSVPGFCAGRFTFDFVLCVNKNKGEKEYISFYCACYYFKIWAVWYIQFKWFKFAWNDCCLFCLLLLKSPISMDDDGQFHCHLIHLWMISLGIFFCCCCCSYIKCIHYTLITQWSGIWCVCVDMDTSYHLQVAKKKLYIWFPLRAVLSAL